MSEPLRVAVVGAGVTGLAATVELLRRGIAVDLYSVLPSTHAASATERDGVGAADEGDVEGLEAHLDDTRRAGGELAPAPLVRGLVEAAPGILSELRRLGVPFTAGSGGALRRDPLGGASRARVAHAGVHTGRHVLRVLEAQLLAEEARGGSVRRFARHELVRFVLRDGEVVGLVAHDQRAMRHEARAHAAVLLATGSALAPFERVAGARSGTGAAALAAFAQGALFADADRVEVHPTTFVAGRGRHVAAELLRAHGARLWAPRDPDDPRALPAIPASDRETLDDDPPDGRAARALVVARSRAVAGARRVVLDLRAVPRELVAAELGARAPTDGLLEVGPAIVGALGGLWVDHEADAEGRLCSDSARQQATSLPGLYAAGDAAPSLHGAARLPENALLGCVFTGRLAAAAITAHVRGSARPVDVSAASTLEAEAREADAELERRVSSDDGGADPIAVLDELRSALDPLLDGASDARALGEARDRIEAIAERARTVRCVDATLPLGEGPALVREVNAALTLARLFVGTASARAALPEAERAAASILARAAARGADRPEPRFERGGGVASVARGDAAGVGEGDAPEAVLASVASRAEGDDGALAPGDVASALASAEAQLRSFRVRVLRSASAGGAAPAWQEFRLAWRPGLTVHDCLELIRRDPVTTSGERVTPPRWDASCAEGRCGACTVRVGGRARQACTTEIDPLMLERRAAIVDVAPLAKLPVLRDLVVDRAAMLERLREVEAWIDLESTPPSDAARPRPARAAPTSACIGCGACLDACPEVHARSSFVGAAALHAASLAVAAQPGEAARATLDALTGPGGVAGCGRARNCVEVCPAALPLDESIAAMGAAATKQLFGTWLRRR